ncbi:MAG: FAD-dependent oxidoreductase [Acidobacteria bacterium]|nr:FAD-dependent oxidoreductase [Acidobacteriota bacterium]
MQKYNLVVIGGGSGGLVVAAGGAGLGARVALAEKHKMGGDCLNYGCVPSKSLLRAARAVHQVRAASRFGIQNTTDPGPQDFLPVRDYIRASQAHIAPHDSVERFSGLGVEVFQAAARLVSPHEVDVDGKRLWGRHIVVATGSRARVPSTPGLLEAGFLTNESIFSIEQLPGSLAVLGGGPIGVEIGQAFARLGSKVTIVSRTPHIVPKEDPDAAQALTRSLRNEGVTVLDRSEVISVRLVSGKKRLEIAGTGSSPSHVDVEEILVAAGRTPNVEGLGLENAGVAVSAKGIQTDRRCRTTSPSVWAIGDVAGEFLFTHWAGYQARVILRNTLFPLTVECDYENLPWTTFTDPEIARVGHSETSASKAGIPHDVFRVEFSSNDRAVCDGEHEGSFAKVLADRKGRILGATIVHPHAGDLLAELVLAKKHGLRLPALSNTVHAYPTLSEIGRALGDAYMRTRLTAGTKSRLTKVYQWLRR